MNTAPSATQMLGNIVLHTPTWVWFLLAALIVAGLTQARRRVVTMRRVVVLPVAMTGLSLWGLTAAFARSTLYGDMLLTWMVFASITIAAVAVTRPPAGTAYDAWTGRFQLPGSWVPLATIVGIFLVRYTVNVQLAIHPECVQALEFAIGVAALYGFFSGLFIGRAARLWRLALRTEAVAQPA